MYIYLYIHLCIYIQALSLNEHVRLHRSSELGSDAKVCSCMCLRGCVGGGVCKGVCVCVCAVVLMCCNSPHQSPPACASSRPCAQPPPLPSGAARPGSPDGKEPDRPPRIPPSMFAPPSRSTPSRSTPLLMAFRPESQLDGVRQTISVTCLATWG